MTTLREESPNHWKMSWPGTVMVNEYVIRRIQWILNREGRFVKFICGDIVVKLNPKFTWINLKFWIFIFCNNRLSKLKNSNLMTWFLNLEIGFNFLSRRYQLRISVTKLIFGKLCAYVRFKFWYESGGRGYDQKAINYVPNE